MAQPSPFPGRELVIITSAWLVCLVPLLLFGDHVAGDHPPSTGPHTKRTAALRRAYLALLAVTLLSAVAVAARLILHNITSPPWWDLRGFWMYGRVADAGLNPYLPGPYHALAGPGPFPQSFGEQLLDIGCVYPPPTLLLFGLIGWMPLRTAAAVWMTIQASAFAGAVVLLWRTLLPTRDARGLMLAAGLTLIFPPSKWTFGYGQINFIALLFIMAAWSARNRSMAGAYLVGAAVIKPVYVVLWVYPLLRARWRTLIVGFLTGAALCLAAIGVYGTNVFLSYLRDNPVTTRLPLLGPSYFSDIVNRNQSLLGAILRLVPYQPAHGLPTSDPIYLAAAFAVIAVAAWAVAQAIRMPDGEGLVTAILLPTGLLIYPWTLTHYFVVLIAPMLFLWERRGTSPIGVALTAALITCVFLIMQYHSGNIAIVGCALLWAALIAIAVGGTAHGTIAAAALSPAARARKLA
jgi:glycosyl transferase family 87